MEYYLAVDIGASSGRHILASIEDGKLRLEEIYRFENNYRRTEEGLCWDIDSLRKEVMAGIRHAAEIGRTPATIGIDTWACDYVLLDKDGQILYPVYAYRDARTLTVQEEAEARMPFAELYKRTGIQKQNFNSVYQLFCDSVSGKLAKASRFLMIPDYLAYVLTGEAVNEYTNASTTAMVNAQTKTWDPEILKAFDIPEGIFSKPQMPGTPVGHFSKEMKEYAGYDALVVLAPTHDTASAVAACPLTDRSVYISSGTWSLMGTENTEPIISDKSRQYNFTNEGGVEYRFRYLKNIMGTWLFQNIRRELDKKYSFPDLIAMAEKSEHYVEFDVNNELLVAPESMILAIQTMMKEPGASLPDVLNSAYHSLGRAYGDTVREIEKTTGKTIDRIIIVGGGSQDHYLNRMTAQYTGKPVYIGLKEATATGNIIAQIMNRRNYTLAEARELVRATFELTEEKA